MRNILSLTIAVITLVALCTSCGPSKLTYTQKSAPDSLENHSILKMTSKEAHDKYYELVGLASNYPNVDKYQDIRLSYLQSRQARSGYLMDSLSSCLENKTYEKAKPLIDSIYTKNFYNPRFHFYSFIVYKNLNEMEKADKHVYYYQRLLKSIENSGDGKTPETAYIVINVSEEYDLLRYLQMESRGQSLSSIEGHMYDILSIENSEGKKDKVYFNIDLFFGKLY